MGRLTKRIDNDLVVYTQGKYEYTTAGEMTSDNVRKVLAKLCEYEDKEYITNADRIRNMANEELARYLGLIQAHTIKSQQVDSIEDMLKWLQAEVKEGNSNENT